MMLLTMKQEWNQPESTAKRLDSSSTALEQGVSQFNGFYAKMLFQLQDRETLRSNSPDLETLRQASKIACEI